MPKTRYMQSSFVSGELSPLLLGRSDLDQYYEGCQAAENLVIVPQGGLKRRAGTEFIAKALPSLDRVTELPTMINGGVPATINDGDDSTNSATTIVMGTTDPYVVAEYDLTTATYIEFADIRDVVLNTGSSTEFFVEHSDDAITWATAAIVPSIKSVAQDFRLFVGATKRYWRFVRIGATDMPTALVSLGEFSLQKLSATLSNVKTFDFSVESDRHYLMVLTDTNMRVYRTPDIHVADIKVPYIDSQVMSVRDAQTESVMLMFHGDTAPLRLINGGTDSVWALDNVPFTNVPQYDYFDDSSPTPVSDVQVMTLTSFVAGDTFQIDIDGVLSKNITIAGDVGGDQQNSTVSNIQKNIQDMPVMGEGGVTVQRTGGSSYTITSADDSAKDFELFSGFATTGTAAKTIAFNRILPKGSSRSEDVWSSSRGYPKMGVFYDGRLWLGGTKSKPQSILASKAGTFFDFDIDEGSDDEGIFITISARQLSDIVDINPARGLQVFTFGSEFLVKGNTPSTISIDAQTQHGATSMEVKSVDGATLFLDRNGKTLREYVYNFNEDSYTSNDLSVLASHLINAPTDIAMLSGSTSEDANWLFIANADGSVAVLNTLRSQGINGFTPMTTQGFVTTLSVVDDELYMVNKRTLGVTESYFIERWSFDRMMDNSTTILGNNSTSVSGLDHFEGHTVQITADGNVLPERAVSGGSITLSAGETSIADRDLEIGINFPVSLKTMPVNTNIGSGQNSMRIKKITRINARVHNTFGVFIDGNPIAIRSFGDVAISPLDNAILVETGIIEDNAGGNGWNRFVVPSITVPDPTPFHIQSIEYEVESS
jgi:hypothetical protein